MNYKEIFESLLLTDEVKEQLEEALATSITAKETLLEAEYLEKTEQLQENMLGTVQDLVAEALSEELEVLAEELAHARSLDVSYAEKLELFKESYAETQDELLKVTVAEAVQEEVSELIGDIEYAKQNAFGNKLYESFKDMFDANFGGAEIDVVERLRESEERLEKYQRDEAIEELLEGIGGRERGVFISLLEGVALDKLANRFDTLKDIVLRETVEPIVEPIKENLTKVVADEHELVVEASVQSSDLTAAFNRALNIANRKLV